MLRTKRFLFMGWLLVLLVAFIGVTKSQAQSILEGKITGTITDDKGEPLPGATVELTSPAMMGKRSAVTSAKGTYFLLNLPIGKYKLTASMPNFKTVARDDIEVTAGSSMVVNVALPLGAIEETVTVTGTAPVVDVKTSSIDAKINQEMLDKLPTSRDSWYDLSLSTPGMFDTGKEAMGSPTAYGESGQGNIFLVNGVDTTNPDGAGYGSLMNVNYNTIQEVRVISLGAKAEYGNFSGAAIDVITKSGSNQLRGSLSYYTQAGVPKTGVPPADKLGRDWLFLAPGTNFDFYPKSDREYDLTLGGRIIYEKLWFFVAGNLLNGKEKILDWTPLVWNKQRYGDIKITGNPLKNHRAWVAYHYEKNRSGGDSGGGDHMNWDESLTTDTNEKSQSISAQWQWFPRTTTFFSVKYLGFLVDSRAALPEGHADYAGMVNWWKGVPASAAVGGAWEAYFGDAYSRSTIQADVSHYAENFLGEHDIKFGVQYTRGRRDNFSGNFFSKHFTNPETGDDLGLLGYYQFGYMYGSAYSSIEATKYYYGIDGQDGIVMYANQYLSTPFKTVRTSDSTGFFFDDQWTPNDRLTFNLGVRYDRMTAKFGKGQILKQPDTPEGFAETLDVLRDRKGSGNLFDFKCLSPRLGVTYQLTNDRKTALRASFGRYYSPLGVESFGSSGPDLDRHYRLTKYYLMPWEGLDLNGDGVIWDKETVELTRKFMDGLRDGSLTPINAVVTSPSGDELDLTDRLTILDPSLNPWQLKIHPGLKNQHTDQFTLSLEREIFQDFSVALTYIYRNTRNMIVEWPINKVTGQPWEYERKTQVINGQEVSLYSVVIKDYNGDGKISNGDGGDIQWFNENQDIEWRNMPDWDGNKARRLFQGIQMTFNKRYSNRWQLMGSMLWNSSSGPAARNKRQDQDYNLEGSNIWNDHWVSGVNQLINNMTGSLPFTPRFEFKLNGNYTIPVIEVDLGLRFRMHTGRPIWVTQEIGQRISESIDLTDADKMAHAVLVTGGTQIVAQDPKDPLYMPVLKILDLRLEKAFNLGPGKLHFIFDAFNVFNSQDVTNAFAKRVEGVNTVGQISGIVAPRKLRAGIMYEF
jgi:outer membrane receptor protein involved in Fe transport